MQIDLEHLHHWMQAIRQSPDPMRTMDAFWRGQILSKEWLIDKLKSYKHHTKEWPSIEIHGGWVGTLASMLFQSELYISHITSIDIDLECEEIARRMKQIELEVGKFRAVTADMCQHQINADIVINTSFEHISQFQYDTWLSNVPDNSLIILQSNNYQIPEHVRIAADIEMFKNQSRLNTIFYADELDLPLYKRFMIIGKK